jgi:hypothetical protein
MTDHSHGSDDSSAPEDDYPVGTPDPEVETGEPLMQVDPDKILGLDSRRGDPMQFSVAELLVMIAVVALVLGVLAVLPRQYAAGLAGLGVLVSLLVITVVQPTRPIVMITWWALFVVYLMMSVAAMLPLAAQ